MMEYAPLAPFQFSTETVGAVPKATATALEELALRALDALADDTIPLEMLALESAALVGELDPKHATSCAETTRLRIEPDILCIVIGTS
jgi:hypothetical protein